jgi:hypothetical protein
MICRNVCSSIEMGSARFTKKYRINRLVWYEGTTSVRAAILCEKQIKGWLRAKKIALIGSMNPAFRDLSRDFMPRDVSVVQRRLGGGAGQAGSASRVRFG